MNFYTNVLVDILREYQINNTNMMQTQLKFLNNNER